MNATLSALTANNAISIIGGILVTLLAGMTAFLANRHIAVFNDGVRPLVGQRRQGNLKYKALAGMSFAMSIGYVIGFIPFSLSVNILIMHTILLGSEMIGLVFPKKREYTVLAVILALAYGAAIYWGLKGLSWVIENATYPGFGFDLGQITDSAFPFIFSMFPAIATFLQSGWKKGFLAVLASVIVYIIVALFGWKQHNLYPMAITLLAGSFIMLAFALWDNKKIQKTKNIENNNLANKQFKIFEENVKVIKKNKWWFVISGAIAAMVITSFAGAPNVSMALQTSTMQEGDVMSALIADTTWVIGFLPLVVLTALLTGVYSPVGLTAVFVWGDIAKIIGGAMVQSTGHENMYLLAILISGVLGGLSLFGEIYILKKLAIVLQKIPSIQKLSDTMRTSISKTITAAFIFGGVVAAFIMGQHVASLISAEGSAWAGLSIWLPSMGAGLVLLLITINGMTKRKLAEIAIGPIGAVLVGIIFNIIYFIALAS